MVGFGITPPQKKLLPKTMQAKNRRIKDVRRDSFSLTLSPGENEAALVEVASVVEDRHPFDFTPALGAVHGPPSLSS
jgi:hypothetical protein